MDRLKLVLTSKEVGFKISLNVSRDVGLQGIRQLIEKELEDSNEDSNYRIIGSLNELNGDEILTLLIERQSGNKRFDVIKAKLKILINSSFEMSGHIQNKCQIYGQLGIILFLIGLSIFIFPKINSDNYLAFFLYPIIIIWLLVDIYLRPIKALNFLTTKIRQIESK